MTVKFPEVHKDSAKEVVPKFLLDCVRRNSCLQVTRLNIKNNGINCYKYYTSSKVGVRIVLHSKNNLNNNKGYPKSKFPNYLSGNTTMQTFTTQNFRVRCFFY